MARAIRWTIPFKSFNGTSCHVDIYDEGFAGEVTTLKGDAEPFYYEEGNSSDLLNDVVRYRTGYINVIEENATQLADIYPTTDKQRYVEFYYGASLNFCGYIQVQSFDVDWTAYPRVVSLPVLSPLGIADKLRFGTIYPPVVKTLGQLLDTVITGLGAAYTHVYLPHITDIDFSLEIFSLIASPWNENYHHSIAAATESVFMGAETYWYFIEGICKAFGWMVHDTPNALMFTMFDHIGLYDQYTVGHIGDANYKTVVPAPTDTVFPLTNWFTYRDNDAKQSMILPTDSIEIDYDGELEDGVECGLERTRYVSVSGYGDRYNTSVCNLDPVTNEVQVTGGTVVFDANHHAAYGNYAIALGDEEGILCALDPAMVSDATLFRVRYYTKTAGRHWQLDYDISIGEFIANLEHDDAIRDNIHTTMTIADNYIEVQFKLFYNTTYPFPTAKLLFFTRIRLDLITNNELYQSYKIRPADSADVLPNVSYMGASESVSMPFSLYREGTNLIGNTVKTTKLTTYPYMFAPRNQLIAKFVGTMADMYAARLYSFWKTGWVWRIIAVAFYPRNDEYELTMQESSAIEDILNGTATRSLPEDESVEVEENDPPQEEQVVRRSPAKNKIIGPRIIDGDAEGAGAGGETTTQNR